MEVCLHNNDSNVISMNSLITIIANAMEKSKLGEVSFYENDLFSSPLQRIKFASIILCLQFMMITMMDVILLLPLLLMIMLMWRVMVQLCIWIMIIIMLYVIAILLILFMMLLKFIMRVENMVLNISILLRFLSLSSKS